MKVPPCAFFVDLGISPAPSFDGAPFLGLRSDPVPLTLKSEESDMPGLGQILTVATLTAMLTGGIYFAEDRYMNETQAATQHVQLVDGTKSVQAFAFEIAGRLDQKIRADKIANFKTQKWQILKHYNVRKCSKIKSDDDFKECTELEELIKTLKAKKK